MPFYNKFEQLLKNAETSSDQIKAFLMAEELNADDLAVLLFSAVEADNLNAVKGLVEFGADPSLIISDDKNSISLAIDQDKWEILEYLMTKEFNKSMMFVGIEMLSPMMIDYLESKYIKVPHELKNSEDMDWINQIN